MSRQSVPTVLDAGALELADRMKQPTLITPHAGELSRLLTARGEKVSSELIESDPKKWAAIASELFGVVVLLKGTHTVVAFEGGLIELPESTPWLATAGSGDVLAGIIGALVATNYIEILNSPIRLAQVAASGAYIHNAAALLASNGAPICATSMIETIPQAIRKVLG
jgi:NAD(P)H-hydrate repair Nnr-like enzyme with NAD(P)H-hydrate dehydratase domain